MDALTLDFSFLLTSQLESQRRFLEERITACEREHLDSMKKIDQEMLVLWDDYREIQMNRDELLRELDKERREKKILERKIQSIQSRLAKLDSDLKEERQMNTNLLETQMKSRDKESEKERQIQDLSEQIHDLTFTLETLNRVENSPCKEEIRGGSIIMKSTNSSQSKFPTKPQKKA